MTDNAAIAQVRFSPVMRDPSKCIPGGDQGTITGDDGYLSSGRGWCATDESREAIEGLPTRTCRWPSIGVRSVVELAAPCGANRATATTWHHTYSLYVFAGTAMDRLE